MCELFGFSSSFPRRINRDLKDFYSHSNEHPHGWGLAVFDGETSVFEKEAKKALSSTYLKERLNEDIEATVALGHIRFATVGIPERKNTHPFVGRDKTGRTWTLIHNGTIFEGPALKSYYEMQKGDTDSERILLHLLNLVNSNPDKDRFSVVEELISELSPKNKLNLIIYDGEYLYAHTNLKGSLHALEKAGEVVISTNPLYDGDWKPLPLCTPLAFKAGKRVRTGKNHGNEYIPDPKQIAELYWAFSNL